MMIDIVTIFPEMFQNVFDSGIIRRARQGKLLEVRLVDLRDFTSDRHRTVDDRPFGGGEGMVMKPEPILEAVQQLKSKVSGESHVILLTPRGRLFDQGKAKELAACDHLVVICGRYEGVDQRIADHLVDEEISFGDYVVSGGEIVAMLLVDAVSRLIPGAVGNASSVLEDSFMNGLLDYPQYTRPADYKGWKVPEVLLSGDHSRIGQWREQQARDLTRRRRPDLLTDSDEDAGQDCE
jgi:tRNA (guanine37-N1)-methyltransferase